MLGATALAALPSCMFTRGSLDSPHLGSFNEVYFETKFREGEAPAELFGVDASGSAGARPLSFETGFSSLRFPRVPQC